MGISAESILTSAPSIHEWIKIDFGYKLHRDKLQIKVIAGATTVWLDGMLILNKICTDRPAEWRYSDEMALRATLPKTVRATMSGLPKQTTETARQIMCARGHAKVPQQLKNKCFDERHLFLGSCHSLLMKCSKTVCRPLCSGANTFSAENKKWLERN